MIPEPMSLSVDGPFAGCDGAERRAAGQSRGRRIVSVWFAHFPVERWRRQAERLGNPMPEDVPFALSAAGPHGPVVHAANRAAALAGVRTGARVVDMRALCPALRVECADPGLDRAALDRLALWARRWCPWTAVDESAGGHGLVLDTTGADHLWGGEAAMLREIEARFSLLGLSARLALAPTWGAAWALARFGPVRAIWQGPADAEGLPVAALRLGEETCDLLHRLGLRTVGALVAIPRLSLARRFSRAPLAQNPLLRLDQMSGDLAEPVSAPEAEPVFRADIRLAEPIFDPTQYLPSLAADLCAQLVRAGQGARRLRLSVYRSDGEVSRIEVATVAASRDGAHLAWLFRDRVERIDPGFGFDQISFEAAVAEPLRIAQSDLGGTAEGGLDLGQLIDRLTVRFGAKAISRPAPVASHIPERAEARGGPAPSEADPALWRTERPVSLLCLPEEIRVVYPVPEGPPAQFVWRRRSHRVTRYQGPERIAPEWWQDRPGTRLRDYFKVEDEAGARFWLYREGLFHDGRGGAPRWFMHGMFP
jgi:protein ImuB